MTSVINPNRERSNSLSRFATKILEKKKCDLVSLLILCMCYIYTMDHRPNFGNLSSKMERPGTSQEANDEYNFWGGVGQYSISVESI